MLVILLALLVQTDVKPNPLFSDNMVLQRELPAPVWGTAEPGTDICVSIGEQKKTCKADKDGRWLIRLDPLAAGGPFELHINEIVLKNIPVGDVWLGSGQSNMDFPIGAAANAQEETANANFPKIRIFRVKNTAKDEPQSEVKGRWNECNPKTIAGFSAVAYFFGRELHRSLDVPIGLIYSSWGGTPIEAWMSESTLRADPDSKPAFERWKHSLENFPQAIEEYHKQVEAWEQEAAKAEAAGSTPPKKPKRPANPKYSAPSYGRLYNGMIAPLIPFAIKGVIWYQGESNVMQAAQYRRWFSAMIADWRGAWGQGEFPFLFVQLANFFPKKSAPSDTDWARLREAQLLTLSVPKTAMAVAIDIGDEKDIHPKNKQDVGRRLALGALAVAYGKDVEYSGPIYESMKVEGDTIRLTFKHADGLTARGDKLLGFAMAGEDRRFVWAEAKIDGNTVVVSGVPNPVAVRYAWADSPDCGLYNKAGLPASPFRTDAWPRPSK